MPVYDAAAIQFDEEQPQASGVTYDASEVKFDEEETSAAAPDKTWMEDVGTSFGRGAASMVRTGGMALRKVGLEAAGKAWDDVGRENEEYLGGYSPETTAARGKNWINEDGSFNSDLTLDDMARKVAISSVESLPGQVPMAIVGGILTKAAMKAAPLVASGMAPVIASAPVQKVLSNGVVRKGLDSTVGKFIFGETAAGTAPQMATEAAQLAARGVGFGAAEGAYSGLSNAVEVGDRVRKEVGLDSFFPPEYRGYGFDENVPAPPPEVVAAAEEKREQVARQAENEVIWKTALVDMAVSIPTGGGAFGEAMRLPEGLFGRGVKRGLVMTAARGFVRGGAGEAGQEFLQSGGENRVSDMALEAANVPGVRPSLIANLNASIEGGLSGMATGGLMGSAGQVSQRSALNVLAQADPDLKKEQQRLALAKEIGASLESPEERAHWADNSITAISLGLPIDLDSADFLTDLNQPRTKSGGNPTDTTDPTNRTDGSQGISDQQPVTTTPLNDEFDDYEAMPAPRGPLARAAAQAVPVVDPLAPGQDLPSMAPVAEPAGSLVLNDSFKEGEDDGNLSGVQQEVGGAPQALPAVWSEDRKEVTLTPVEEDPYALPAISSRMAAVTGAEESPENAALAEEFLAGKKNWQNLAPAFKDRLLADFVTKKTAARALPTPVDALAHEAATSPVNDKAEPTPAQIEAGNYAKGHIKLHGLEIAIENPAGSKRRGVDETGRAWETGLTQHYGYIKRTTGADGEHVDVFVKPGIDATTAGDKIFVVDQKDLKSGGFDESKVMIGFPSIQAARQAYLSNYDSQGPERILDVTMATVDGFKSWLNTADTTKPFSPHTGLTAKGVMTNPPIKPQSDSAAAMNGRADDSAWEKIKPAMERGAVLRLHKKIGRYATEGKDDRSDDNGITISRSRVSKLESTGDLKLIGEGLYAIVEKPLKISQESPVESPSLPAPKGRSAKQLAQAKARATVNPAVDDLLMAIRKLGGIDKAQALAQWGKGAVESEYVTRNALVGKPLLRNKAGLALDTMLTTLKGHGYLPETATLTDFEASFLRAASGEAVLTDVGSDRAADDLYSAEMARLVEEMEAGQAQELAQEIDADLASLIAGAPELAGITPETLEWTADVFNDIVDGGLLMTPDDYLQSILEESDNEGNYTGRAQGAAAQAAGETAKASVVTAQESSDPETPASPRSEVTPAGDQLKMFATPPTFGRKAQPKGDGVARLDLSLSEDETGLFDAPPAVAAAVAPQKKNVIRAARIKHLENKLENGQLQIGNMAELNRLHAIDQPVKPDKIELPDGFGSNNSLFTTDKAEKARALLRAKLNQLNAGIDPEMITAGIDLAGYYVEGGFRTFKAYSDKMVEDLGESIRPFLKSFYLAVRSYPGFDNQGMDSEAGIDELLAVAQVEQAISAPKVKSAAGEKRLRGDYGVKSIDAYTAAGAKAKAEFLKDARDYLKAVGKVLAENGFTPEKVSVNESGVAGSGEVSLIAFKEGSEYGAYVTIGGSALNFGGASPSGIQIMYRDNTRKSKYSGGSNRWDAKWDVTSGEMAARMIAAAEQAEQAAGRKVGAVTTAPATTETTTPAVADKKEVNPVANAPEDGIISTDIPKKESQNDGPLRGSGQELSQGAETGATTGAEGSGGTGEILLSTGSGSDQAANPTRRVGRSGGVGGRRNSAGGPAGLLSDYKITAADRLGKGGAKQKFSDNIAAIETLRLIQAEDREATPDEQAILVRYVGWGGLQQAFPPVGKGWENEARQLKELLSQSDYDAAMRSTQDAHYTSDKIIAGIYKGMARIGFKGGKVLEPAVGTGNFLGLMPAAMKSRTRFTGVELDPTTSAIASLLYPQQTLLNMGFQELTIAPNSFDAAIGNPPFGSQSLFDPAYKSLKSFSIHNFFFAKSIEALRPGGVLAMVVSNSLIDKQGSAQRQWMAERTELLGAIRLPNNAFRENAGTEVTTDVIFLRKLAQGEQAGENRWTELMPVRVDGVTYQVNEYFVRHPEMMLGKIVPVKQRFGAMAGDEYNSVSGLEAEEGFNFEEAISAAIAKLPENVYIAGKTITEVQKAKIIVPDPGFARPYGYALDQAGRAVRRLMDVNGVPEYELVTYGNEPIEGKRLERYKGMLSVRDAVRRLIRAEMSDDPTMTQLRKDLNSTYDAFVAHHGYISDTANASILQDDPTDFPLLKSLEHKYDKGVSTSEAKKNGVEAAPSSAQKAAIFRVRTREPYRQATSADSAKDGLMIVLRENGWVDLARIQSLTGQSEASVLAELRGMVFKSPESGAYETADTYLSGNVKKKLTAALKAVEGDSTFASNVEELQKVQPADIEAEDIFVKLGSHWIPPDVYEAFFREAAAAAVKVRYNRDLGHWSFRDSDVGKPTSRFDSPGMSAYEIIEKLIVGNSIAIYSKDDKGERVFDKELTMQANEKAGEIEREFATWLWSDFDRRDRLAKIYNTEINTSVDPKFDGSHMIFPGMGIISPNVGRDDQLREHQKNGVWRLVQKGYGLLDHVVGAGKTFASIAAGLEMKRMGLIRKPMYVVPNHLVGQWAEDFQRLYPGANILVITKKDFSKKNRQEFMGRIATGDWDAVVVAHSSFGFIPAPVEFERRFYADMIAQYEAAIRQMEIEEGKTKSRSTKDMEKSKDKLKEKLKALADRETDNVVDFSEIGVDSVFVDEMHNFKNLFYVTKHTRGVAGLGDINGSKKAFDMFVKTRYLASENQGRGVFSMTGTPVSNSIAEMYTMMRYHEYEALEEMGIHHFDQWANLFADISSDWELDPTGTRYRLQARFRQFTNIPEMMKIYRGFADVVSQQNLRDMAKARGKVWPIPDVSGSKPQNIVVERSELQARYMDYVIHRMDNMPSDKKKDNPLNATTDAMKAALDMRLIDPSYPDHPGSKINSAARNIAATYQKWNAQKGTQLVFCDLSVPSKERARLAKDYDALVEKAGTLAEAIASERNDEKRVDLEDELAQTEEKINAYSPADIAAFSSKFSVYDDLKAKLVAQGIPAHQIAFIHDANTDLQKDALFAKVKQGKVRVLIGSTMKMGAGMNVQDKLVALHHIDAPWRPSDLEQREGRIIRQGNEFFEAALAAGNPSTFSVDILRYATKETLDARRWQVLEGKAIVVEQLRASSGMVGRKIEDIGGEAANSAEMKAAASGNPLILEEIQLRREIEKIEILRRGWNATKMRYQAALRDATTIDKRVDDEIAKIHQDVAKVKAHPHRVTSDEWSVEIEEKTFKAKLKALRGDAKEQKEIAKQNDESVSLNKKKAATEVLTLVKDILDKKIKVAGLTYRGFDVDLSSSLFGSLVVKLHHSFQSRSEYGTITNSETIYYGENDKFSGSGLFTRLDNLIDGFARNEAELVGNVEKERTQVLAAAAVAEREMNKPFERDQEYTEKLARHKEVLGQLRADDSKTKTQVDTSRFADFADQRQRGPQLIEDDDAAVDDAAKFAVRPLVRGPSGLGKVTITPVRSLPFIRQTLEKENLQQVKVTGGESEQLRSIAKAFGRTIVFFQGKPGPDAGFGMDKSGSRQTVRNDGADAGKVLAGESGGLVEGFVHPGRPDLIYLNVEAVSPSLFLLGHEVGHALKMDDPTLWRQMATELQPLVRNWSDYQAKLDDPRYARLSEEEQAEELFGDVIGTNFMNEIFWREMAERNVSLFRKIARRALALLNQALRLFSANERGTARYVSDMTQARAIVAKTLLAYGEKAQAGSYARQAKQEDGSYLQERLDGAEILRRLAAAGITEEMLTKVLAGTRFAAAWHGSPHNHDKFKSEKIGTGEGAQAYGWGLYFAGAREVAEWYRDKLKDDAVSNDETLRLLGNKKFDALMDVDMLGFDTVKEAEAVIRKHPDTWMEMYEVTAEEGANINRLVNAYKDRYASIKGSLYQVELAPTEDEYLLWDKPLSEQSEKIQKALETYMRETNNFAWRDIDSTGGSIYKKRTSQIRSDKAVSEELHSLGIRGIKYLDGTSRSQGEGNFNYVIFHEDDVAITAKYSIRSAAEKIDPRGALAKIKDFLNPLDYARLRKTVIARRNNDFIMALADNLGNPYWIKENNPAAGPFYEEAKDREVTRMDNNIRMFGGLVDNTGQRTTWEKVKSLGQWSEHTTAWGKLRKEQYDVLSAAQKAAYDVIRFEGDAYGKTYATLSNALRNPRIKAAGLDAPTFAFYRAAIKAEAESFEEKLKIAADNMAEAGIDPEVIRGHIAEYRTRFVDLEGWVHRDHGEGDHVVRVYHAIERLDFTADVVQHQGKATDRIRLNYFPGVELSRTIERMTENLEGSFLQLQDGAIIMLFEQGLGAEALERFAHIPLTDKAGKVKHQVLVYNRFVGNEAEARQLAAEVNKDLATAAKKPADEIRKSTTMPRNYRQGHSYDVSWKFSDKIKEADFQELKTSDMKLELILSQAIDKAATKEGLDKGEVSKIHEALVQNVAETLLGRGAGLYQIRRAKYLIEGYEQSGALKKYENYVNGTAGLFSKARYALRQYKNMKQVPAKLRTWATRYVSDSLRNMGNADRMSGNIRSIVSLWFLGFNFSWMLVNSTQPLVLGQAELSRFTKGAALKIMKAEKDILFGRVSEEEQGILNEHATITQDRDSMMAEMTGALEGVGGAFSQGLHATTSVAMALGQKVEVLNRHTMILAGYRTFRGQGMNREEAYNKALAVNSATNIDMGRFNLPAWARKPVGRTFYSLMSYIHHMLNYLYNRSSSGNRNDQKAVLRLLFAMFLLGGLPAGVPGSDELDEMIKNIFGYSPKLALKGWLRKQAKNYGSVGELLESFVWRGVPGMAGISLTGATQIRLPILTNILGGDDITKSVTGPVGGLVQKGLNAGSALQKGDYLRAAEFAAPTALANPLSGMRQATTGVKTQHGKPVLYKGQPLKMTKGEAALRTIGLQPARTADISELRGARFDLQGEWNERRQLALDRYRTNRQLKIIQEFNKGLRDSQAQGLVNPITVDSLRQQTKPSKKLTQWERDKGFE